MGMHYVRPDFYKKPQDCEKAGDIAQRACGAYEIADKMCFNTRHGGRLTVQYPPLAGYKHRRELLTVQVAQSIKRILLRATQLQHSNNMTNLYFFHCYLVSFL